MDNRIPLFSIITPTYNCGKKIEKTIESVLAQDRNLFEYIIVDGGSNKETLSIINRYKSIINIISEKDNGVYDAMNKGINLSRGKYLYFIGAGDILESNVLLKIKSIIDKSDYDIIYGDVYRFDTKKIYGGAFNKFKIINKNICHQAIFYKKDIFKLLGYYDINYKILADYAFNIKCFGNNILKKKYVNLIICKYEGYGISSNIYDKKFFEDKTMLIKENMEILPYIYCVILNIINKFKLFAKSILRREY